MENQDISKRIREAKSKTQKLEAELKEMIRSGIQQNQQVPEQTKETVTPPVQIIKAYDVKHSAHVAQTKEQTGAISKPKEPQPECSSQKPKPYNVEEAREYMKKQKQRRIEQRKQIHTEKNIQAEIKKKKLEELHKKTLELLNKNVKANRSRSNSRDRGRDEQCLVDHRVTQRRSRSVTHITEEKIPSNNNKPSENVPNLTGKKNNAVVSKHLTNGEGDTLKKKQLPLQITQTHSTVAPHEEEKVTILQNIVVQGGDDSNSQHDKRTSTPKLDRESIKPPVPSSDICCKETQTVTTKNEFPKWLQETSLEPSPLNVINTFRRKLEASIQPKINLTKAASEVDAPLATPTVETNIPELVLHSSPKCKNLDARVVERYELIPSKRTKTEYSTSGSESDTSKNIPSISSESCGGTTLTKIKPAEPVIREDGKDSERTRKVRSNTSDKTIGSTIASAKDSTHNTQLTHSIRSKSNNYETKSPTNKSSDVPQKQQPTSSVSSAKKSTSSVESIISSRKVDTEKSPQLQDGASASIKTSISSKNYRSRSPTLISVASAEKLPQPDSISSSSIKTNTSTKKSKSPTKTFLDSSQQQSKFRFVNTRRGSSCYIEPLDVPVVQLVSSNTSKKHDDNDDDGDKRSRVLRNITVRTNQQDVKPNEIHLKFEAEIHLLNDFNESLRQFTEIERAFETLKQHRPEKGKQDQIPNQNVVKETKDAQTSAKSSVVKSDSERQSSDKENSVISNISYSRGSFDRHDLTLRPLDGKSDSSLALTGIDLSEIEASKGSSSVTSAVREISSVDTEPLDPFTKTYLTVFERLIKDEDARLENLKTILKIREKALLDRTRSELAWLEIQRKHLKETGKLHEASSVKKKQRAILLNHQKEKNEMQRLKQIKKTESAERKTILKQQSKQLIQFSNNNNMSLRMKFNTPRERKLSGPMKVIQSKTESIRSETSLSRRSSTDREKEVYSITSHHSVVSRVSEYSELDMSEVERRQSVLKKSLLMKETALKRRRRAAEELLQCHQKLLEEEKHVEQLETMAKEIICQKKTASASAIARKRRMWNVPRQSGDQEKGTPATDDYGSDFEVDSDRDEAETVAEDIKDLIDDFSRVEQDISMLGQRLDVLDGSGVAADASTRTKSSKSESRDVSKKTGVQPDESVQESIVHLADNLKENLITSQDILTDLNQKVNDAEESTEVTSDVLSQINTDVAGTASKTNEIDVVSKQTSEEIPLLEDSIKENLTTSQDILINLSRTADESRETEGIKEAAETTQELPLKVSKDITSVDKSTTVSNLTEQNIPKRESEKSLGDERNDALKTSGSVSEVESSEVPEVTKSSGTTKAPTQSTEGEVIFKGSSIEETSSEVSTKGTEDVNDEAIELSVLEDKIGPRSELVEDQLHEIISKEVGKGLVSVLEGVTSLSTTLEKSVTSAHKGTEVPKITVDLVPAPENIDEEFQDIPEHDKSFVDADIPKITVDLVHSPELEESIDEELEEIPEHDKSFVERADAGVPKITVDLVPSPELEENIDEEFEDITEHDKSFIGVKLEDTPKQELDDVSKNDIRTSSSVPDKSEDKRLKEESSKTCASSKGSIGVIPSIVIDCVGSPQSDTTSEDTDVDEELSLDAVSEERIDDDSKKSLSVLEESERKGEVTRECDESVSTSSRTHTCSKDRIADLSYGFAPKSETVGTNTTTKEEINSYEEKEQDSLLTDDVQQPNENTSLPLVVNLDESDVACSGTVLSDGGAQKNSPDSAGSPMEEERMVTAAAIFGDEAEEILRKQLAIEQEIKEITEQQQKEQLPFVFIREIPNKPPPPYTPPSSLANVSTSPQTIIPTKEEIDEITKYASKILYKAHLGNKLDVVSISDSTLNLIGTTINKDCYRFVFDLCKDICKEHYGQFVEEKCPSWMKVGKSSAKLVADKPLDLQGLERYMCRRLREQFGYEEKRPMRETAIIKRCKKKRSYVDQLLITESLKKEAEWTNYEKDEKLVIDRTTNEIMDMLIKDTVEALKHVYERKTRLIKEKS